MSDFAAKIAGLSPQKLALLCVELKSALDAQTRRAAEPIAVIGLACRMPGRADNPEAFWQLLRDGRDATREVPPDRWNPDEWYDSDLDAEGRMYTRRGGFLDRVDGFDAAFFRISPREAAALDPQQRLLLEVAWEAIEDAGIPAEQLQRTRTGVFTGIGVDDYAKRQVRAGAPIDIYSGTGNAFCFASGRLSYYFGLQGPSVALDTACSSSLVTVHLACQSLRARDCDYAIAGGVNLMLSPEASVFLSRAKALAPDGRCKTFDAAADGYARSEGCGLLVLRRLSDAQAANDRILAVIRGSAVNHDGPSSGLTVPNGQAQQDVIRMALRSAGIGPAEVGYIEAHGTGTALGDPIEIGALTEVFGGRAEPLWIGSVKTNVGHLETGAGVTSLIKVIQALRHEEIPPHLHFRKPNPHLSLDALPARIPVERVPWRRGARPRIAGVSSFGLSGTNAHIVIEEGPAESTAEAAERPWRLTLSARTPQALARMAIVWRDWLRSDAAAASSVRDICYTASMRRTRHKHELSVAGDTREALARELEQHIEGAAVSAPETVTSPREGRVVSLPGYPFERQRYWYEDGDSVFDFALPVWTNDHRIYDTAIFPATGYLALADQAARDVYGDRTHTIRDFAIVQALRAPANLRLTVKPDGGFEFRSSGTLHATGRIEPSTTDASAVEPPPVGDPGAADYYDALRASGFDYGPAFQGIRELREDGVLWARVELPAAARLSGDRYAAHPALLDACMQSLGRAFEHLASDGMAWLPVGLESFRIHRAGVERVWCRVEPESQTDRASFRLFTYSGLPVADFTGLRLRRTRREALLGTSVAVQTDDWLYELAWKPVPREPAAGRLEGRWLVVSDNAQLAEWLRSRGANVDSRGAGAFDGVVHMGPLESALRVAQSLIQAPAPIWFVTTGADEANPLQAALWGFARTLSLEHPELRGGLIDLDPAAEASSHFSLIEAELAAPDHERQIAFRNGTRLAARLQRAQVPAASATIRSDATYLVTGGTGALGRRVAQWLESRGARHVVLAGRSTADLSREDEIVALLDRIAREMPPLRGIIHAAGVLDDGVIAQQSSERFQRVLAPKVQGALHLDRHTRHLPLDFFVMFSAFSTFLGSPGQSSYVAANSVLDSIARNRRAHGLHALSIGWGPFSEIGMSARLGPRHAAQRRALGIGEIPPDTGMQILDRLIGSGGAHVGVLPIEWNRLLAAFDQSMLAEFRTAAAGAAAPNPLEGLHSASVDTVRQRLTEYLQQEIAHELRYPAGQTPAPSQSLPELGLDSLLALDLRNRLSRDLGIEIAVRAFYESETLGDLARTLASQVRDAATRPLANTPDDALATLHEMSEAELDALLSNLSQGDHA